MSATIDADLFACYFAMPVGPVMDKAPILKVEEKRRPFELKEYYIEDLQPLVDVKPVCPVRK